MTIRKNIEIKERGKSKTWRYCLQCFTSVKLLSRILATVWGKRKEGMSVQ